MQYHHYHHAFALRRRLPPGLEYIATNILKQRWKVRRTSGNLKKYVQQFETDLLKFPNDLGKLRVLHQLYIELGLPHECVRSIARTEMNCPEHHAMFAFAMQLIGTQGVEDHCAMALKSDKKSFWAILALLELYYKQGRHDEGLRVIREFHYESKDFFSNCAMYNLILARKILFQYELGKFDSVYVTVDRINDTTIKCGMNDGYYDNIVCEGEEEMWQSWVKADLAATSWRLRLGSFSLAQELKRYGGTAINPYHLYSDSTEKHTAFDAVFATLSQLASGDSREEILKHVKFLTEKDFRVDEEETSLEPILESEGGESNDLALEFLPSIPPNNNDVLQCIENVGKPLVYALALLGDRDGGEGRAFEALFAVRPKFHAIGGLNSHREVLEETLLVSALRACEVNPAQYGEIASMLSMERIAARPGSAQTWYWRCAIMRAIGNDRLALQAHKRAYELQM